MIANPVVATMIVLALLAVGEAISIATRARVPILLVIMIGYLILLWTGVFPKNLIDNSTFGTIGAVMTAPLIVHMGTLIPLKVIRRQWRAVAINLMGLVFATGLVLVVGGLVLGYATAAASVGPVSGGLIAFIITSTKLKELGLASLVALPALVMAFHSLVGLPLASNFLRRYAKKYRQAFETSEQVAATIEPEAMAVHSREIKPEVAERKNWLPAKYQTNVIMLFQLFIGAAIAVVLGQVTGINYSLWALVVGLIGAYVGFYRDNILERSNAFGLAMVGLIIMILPSLNTVTVGLFLKYLPEVALIIVLGVAGLLLGGYIGSKIFKWDINKGIPVALTATFGFPGDYLLCEEVSRSEAKNEQQKQAIFNEILSPMLVGGFTSVTIASIVIASVVMSTLK